MKPVPVSLLADLWHLWRSEIGEVVGVAPFDRAMAQIAGWTSYQDYVIQQTQRIWEFVEPTLDTEQRRRLSDVLFAVLPASDFNGVCAILPSGQTVIGVSSALGLLTVVNMRLFRAQGYYDALSPLLRAGLANDERAARAAQPLVAELMEIRYAARIACGLATTAELSGDTLGALTEHKDWVDQTYSRQFDFIVLHEIAHVCLRHVEESRRISLARDEGGSRLDLCLPSHKMEFEADEFSLAHMPYDHAELGFPLGALFAFMSLLEVPQFFATERVAREVISVPLGRREFGGTHPPADKRFARLHSHGGIEKDWYQAVSELLRSGFKPGEDSSS